MLKYAYKIIFTLLIILLLANVLIYFNWSFDTYDEVYVVKPAMENMKVTTKLYFVYEDKLRSETRTVDVKNREFEKSIFEELIKGPKTKLFENSLPTEVSVKSFEVIDNIVYINFDNKFIYNDFFTDENFFLHLMAYVNTLTEMKHNIKVQFLIDGEKLTERVHGISLMEPLNRDERAIYIRDISSSDVVISFIEMIFSRRFDLAYEFLDENSKLSYSYQVFQEMMEGYIYYHDGYQRNIYFMQNYDEYDIVTVKFIENEVVDGNQSEIVEQWKVIKSKDSYMIDLTKLIQH
ncbi:MAG: GerMN domain-containing protein [Clostridiales bacterium]|nr:GerMN domain-containing protein [Clostridiales bacterium]